MAGPFPPPSIPHPPVQPFPFPSAVVRYWIGNRHLRHCAYKSYKSDPEIFQIWCATTAILRGGKRQDGTFITENDFKSDATTLTVGRSKVPCIGFNYRALAKNYMCGSAAVWCGSAALTSEAVTSPFSMPTTPTRFWSASRSATLTCSAFRLLPVCGAADNEHLRNLHSGAQQSDLPNTGEVQRNGGNISNTPIDIGDFESFGAVFWVAMRRSDYDNVPTYCSVDEKASPRRTRDCKF